MSDRRVLVIGDYPIGYANGIGETLANLLEGLPDAAVFQCHPDHLQPLGGHERGQASTFRVPRRPAGWPAGAASLYQPVLKLQQLAAGRRLATLAAKMIIDARIGAVLTYPVTPWILFAVIRLRRMFPALRFVFYVMDDWEGHHTCFGLPFTARRRAALAEIVSTADARFACSHVMKHDYEQRFATRWGVLHKGVDVAALPPPARALRVTNILYTGAMNVFRFDAVLAFVEGLRRFRERSGRDVTLTMLGPTPDRDYRARLAPYAFVRTEPWVSNAECQRRMAAADLLYLPLSFDRKLERIANLAMPTKFSEYLASGRPTIFHVPAQSEVHSLAAGAGLPLTLSVADPAAIETFLATLEQGGVDPADYHRRARALLAAEFDQSALRERLAAALFPAA